MGVKLSILKIGVGIITTIGDILLFFGAYEMVSSSDISIALTGIALLILGEILGIYLFRMENRKIKEELQANYLNQIGALFAFPVLLTILHLFSRNKFLLLLALVFALSAFVRTVALLIKVYMTEKA